jgi:hypothetical protein
VPRSYFGSVKAALFLPPVGEHDLVTTSWGADIDFDQHPPCQAARSCFTVSTCRQRAQKNTQISGMPARSIRRTKCIVSWQ